MTQILIVYFSKHGSTRALATQIAEGVESVHGCEAILRTVAPLTATHQALAPAVPASGAPYVQSAELSQCDGLIVGSPTRFGNMAAELKYFFDQTAAQWVNGALDGKPAAVFTSSTSPHGGQESTLLSMVLPLMHHGALWVGLPYSEPDLTRTRSGGSPYGATHVAFDDNPQLTDSEIRLARALGRRVAGVAHALAKPR